jgi:hypothetical protein
MYLITLVVVVLTTAFPLLSRNLQMTLSLQHPQTFDQSSQPNIYEINTPLPEAEDSEPMPFILVFCIQPLKDLTQAERRKRAGSMLPMTWGE